jgi:N-acetylglucosamine kinase-like BadF-type ATPase
VIVAVDGGNSKTDVAIVSVDGRVLSQGRGQGYSPHVYGVRESALGIERLVTQALLDAGKRLGPDHVAHTAAYLAGVDLTRERAQMLASIEGNRWSRTTTVDNDTFALLRLASIGGSGVAVVCGAGINCVAVDRDRTVRFPSLGPISGDWGGGLQLGISAMTAAARDADGRGEHTALTSAILEHFGAAQVIELIELLHFGEIKQTRLAELSPRVFEVAAAGDAVAAGLVARLAEEVSSYAVAALRRLGLTDEAVPVVLGGSILAARHEALEVDIRRRILAVAPNARLLYITEPPILGAVLLGLDAVGAGAEATGFARAQLAPGSLGSPLAEPAL